MPAVLTPAAAPTHAHPTPADPAMMREWRRRARAAAWERAPNRPGGRSALVRGVLGRLVRAPRHAYDMARQPVAVAAARDGHPRWRQALHAWHWSVRAALPPRVFYRYGLHWPVMTTRAHGIVTERQLTDMVYLVTRADGFRARAVVSDKLAFEAWCADHGIPTVAALVRAERGALVVGAPGDLPDVDLFSKQTKAFGGTGARRWARVAPGVWLGTDGDGVTDEAPVDAAGLCAAIAAQSAASGQPVIVQRVLVNHPDLAHLTSGGLATLRHVTIRALDGTVTTTSALYRMPTGGSILDAFSHGGLAAVVDLATGTLGAATNTRLAPAGTWVATHPDTGGAIVGTVLPGWAEIQRMMHRAHAAVPGHAPIIGWDVAFTTDGPVVIEGNIPPSASLQQVPTRTPLGETAVVPTILAYHRALFG